MTSTFNYPLGASGITGLQVSIYPLVGGDVVTADTENLIENIHRLGWYTASFASLGLCWYTISYGGVPGFDSGWVNLVSGLCYPSSVVQTLSTPDILATVVPGAYSSGSAGFALGHLLTDLVAALSVGVTATTPSIPSGPCIDLLVGNDYYAADARAIPLTIVSPTNPIWTGATITLVLEINGVTSSPIPVNAGFMETGTSRPVAFDVPKTAFASLPEGKGTYDVNVVLANNHSYTAVKDGILSLSS